MNNKPKSQTFTKKMRILTNSHFKAVLENNLKFSNELLILYCRKNNCDYPRLGISVGKSCGTAVVRNRLKRLLREVFRQSQHQIPPGYDYLLMILPQWLKKFNEEIKPKQAAKKLKFEKLKNSFLALIAQAGIK